MSCEIEDKSVQASKYENTWSDSFCASGTLPGIDGNKRMKMWGQQRWASGVEV